MITRNDNTVYAGIIAGLATVVLVFCSQFALFFPINLLIVVPIFLIAFSYGTHANFVATLTATIAIIVCISFAMRILAPGFNHPFYVCFIFFIYFFAPASGLAWLYTALKSENSGTYKNTLLEKHYSLGAIFNYLVLYLSVVTTLFCFILLNDTAILNDPVIAQFIAKISQSFIDTMHSLGSNDPELGIVLTQFQGLETFVVLMVMCMVIATTSLFSILAGLYISARIAAYKNWISRQKANWPRDLRLPISAVVIFAITFFLNNIPMSTGLVITPTVFFIVLFVAFLLSGLAFIHYQTRNLTYRLPLLIGIYLCLFSMVLTPLAVLCIVVSGIVATFYKNKTPIHNH